MTLKNVEQANLVNSVVLFGGNDSANTATRSGDIAQISWNQMDMAMKHRLASAFTDVDANVEAIWMELSLQDVTTFHAKFPYLIMFLWFKQKETCHMPFGYD